MQEGNGGQGWDRLISRPLYVAARAPGPAGRCLIRARAGPKPTSGSRPPLRGLWGSRNAPAQLRAISPGGCPERPTRRIPSASGYEATRERACNCQLLGPAAPGPGTPVHGAAAPGAQGYVCGTPALLGLSVTNRGAPAGHSSRGAFPLLFLPLWCRRRGMPLVVDRGAAPVQSPLGDRAGHHQTLCSGCVFCPLRLR